MTKPTFASALFFFVALLFATSVAEAQTRVVVMQFTGAGAPRVRNQAVRALSDVGSLELVPSDQVGSPESSSDYESLSRDLALRAYISGRVVRRGRRYQVTVVARDSQGEEIHRKRYRGRNLNAAGAAVRQGIWRDFEDAIMGARDPEGGSGSGSVGIPAAQAGQDLGPVVVLEFEGPGAGRARGRVVSALEQEGVPLLPLSEAEALGHDLDDEDGRAAAAAELGVAAFIGGEVDRQGRRYSALVTVYNGEDGEEIESAEFRGRNANGLLRSVGSGAFGELSEYISEGEIPERVEDDDDDDGDDDDDDDDDDDWSGPSGPRPSPATLIVEFGGIGRDFSYNDNIFNTLRGYGLPFAPMVGAALYYYPGAHFTDGVLANIGIDARVGSVFGLKSQQCAVPLDSAGQCPAGEILEFPTTLWGFSLGARFRIPFDAHTLTAVVGYGAQSFRIEAISPTVPAPEIPDVDYSFMRIGAEGRFVFGSFLTEVKFAFLPLFGTGQLSHQDWFPNNSGSGLEAGGVVGYLLADWVEVRAAFEYRRFWFTLNPEPGDPWIAGGALDNYFKGSIGLAFHWPGSD
ncbi:MAG: hypothetical protein DRJ42_09400 [Deltaproteobacteria bacterium]|nr:MAG: hypothetical protein DRJ42_09400 [Deltaproteobacteria bacterium]